MSSPNLSTIISDSFADYKASFVTHFIATLLAALLGSILLGLLVGPMHVGYMKMQEKQRNGQPIDFGDVFKGFDDFGPALVVFIIGSIIITIGLFLCVIPGLLVAPILPVALYLVSKGQKDGVQAIKDAWRLVNENLIMCAITMIVLTIVASLGFILCGVGFFLTLPLLNIGSYHLSRQLVGDDTARTGLLLS